MVSRHDLNRALRHCTKSLMLRRRWLERFIDLPLPYHIIRPCKIKLDASTLSIAMLLLGLSYKNRFLPTNIEPQHEFINCLYHTPFEALRCKCHIN